jgi:hypothetical protein
MTNKLSLRPFLLVVSILLLSLAPKIASAQVGQACKDYNDCRSPIDSNFSLDCVDGKCQEGRSCRDTNDCNFLSCNNGSCECNDYWCGLACKYTTDCPTRADIKSRTAYSCLNNRCYQQAMCSQDAECWTPDNQCGWCDVASARCIYGCPNNESHHTAQCEVYQGFSYCNSKLSGFCQIDGQYYRNGTRKPDNSCMVCSAETAPYQWSPVSAILCAQTFKNKTKMGSSFVKPTSYPKIPNKPTGAPLKQSPLGPKS